jgi:hypothetical protein
MIRVGRTRNLLRASSSLSEIWPRSAHHHLGQRHLLGRTDRPDKSPHSITCLRFRNSLQMRAASTREGSTAVAFPPPNGRSRRPRTKPKESQMTALRPLRLSSRRRIRPIPAGRPHPMLRGRAPRSRRWSVVQHSRDAGDRCADLPAVSRACSVASRRRSMIDMMYGLKLFVPAQKDKAVFATPSDWCFRSVTSSISSMNVASRSARKLSDTGGPT